MDQYFHLTHLGWNVIGILGPTFSTKFYWFKILCCLFLKAHSTISFGSGSGLSPHKRQAITWTTDGPVHRFTHIVNPLRPEQNNQHFTDSILKSMKTFELQLKFHFSMFKQSINTKVSNLFKQYINSKSALVHVVDWCRRATNHYLN